MGRDSVSLQAGPSAPRNDTTDETGTVTFPALTANPTSGAQAHYDLVVAPPTGYVALADDVTPSSAAHVQLAPGQTFTTALRVYQPATVTVYAANPPVGAPYTLYVGSARASESWVLDEGTGRHTVSSLAGESLVPLPSSSPYTVGAAAVVGSGGSALYYFTPAESKGVPASYPDDLTQTFNLTFGTPYAAAAVSILTVRVQTSEGAPDGGARIDVTGGPGSVYLTATTPSTGPDVGRVQLVVPTGAGYDITAWGSSGPGQLVDQNVPDDTTATVVVP